MSRILFGIGLSWIIAVISLPWVWLFIRDFIAYAIAFDALIVGVILIAYDDRQEKIQKEIEKERKRNLPTRPPVKVLDTSSGKMEVSEECAKCGLIITPTMVKKERDGLFYHLNCFPGAHAN